MPRAGKKGKMRNKQKVKVHITYVTHTEGRAGTDRSAGQAEVTSWTFPQVTL